MCCYIVMYVQHFRSVSPLGGMQQLWHRAQALTDGLNDAVSVCLNIYLPQYQPIKLFPRNQCEISQVIVDNVVGSVSKREDLIEILRQHIFGHVVHLPGRGTQFYRQHMVNNFHMMKYKCI